MRRQQLCNWLVHQIDPSLYRGIQSPQLSIDKTGSFCVPAAAVQQQPGAARVTALSRQEASYVGAGAGRSNWCIIYASVFSNDNAFLYYIDIACVCLHFDISVWYVVDSNSDIFTPDNAMAPYLRRRVARTSSILLTTRGTVTSSVM